MPNITMACGRLYINNTLIFLKQHSSAYYQNSNEEDILSHLGITTTSHRPLADDKTSMLFPLLKYFFHNKFKLIYLALEIMDTEII